MGATEAAAWAVDAAARFPLEVFPVEIADPPDSIRIINSITKQSISQVEIQTALDSLLLTDENGYFTLDCNISEHLPIQLKKLNFFPASRRML